MKKFACHMLLLFLASVVSCHKWFNVTSDFVTIPTQNGSIPNVEMQFTLNQLIANAIVMNVEMTYYLNLRWLDHRFIRQNSTDPDKNFITMYASDPDWKHIWIPDIYMVNEIPSGILDFSPTDYIRIYENGTLKMSKRHIVAFYCKIRLFKVPMNHDTCSLQFRSNSYAEHEMNLTWYEGDPVQYSADFVSLVSNVKSTTTSKCIDDASSIEERHSCLSLTLNIEQAYKGFVVQVYLPSSAIVIMVWLGFWISLKEVSSRVRVVSVAFTAMVTQMVGVMIVFPDSVELEPLLIWNGFCLCMNLLSFVEFIVVHNLYLSTEQKKKQNVEIDIPGSSSLSDGTVDDILKSKQDRGRPLHVKVASMDQEMTLRPIKTYTVGYMTPTDLIKHAWWLISYFLLYLILYIGVLL